jgi:light-regulated signal transduction histidine kinase (bacteriophytochrome)
MKNVVSASNQEAVKNLTEMELNLQYAIDDLIDESEDQTKLVSQHVSMIITQLAKVAADLRVKKQQEIKKINSPI